MTRTTNARIAGFTFLFYIAAGITNMVLVRRSTSGQDTAAQLSAIAEHVTGMGFVVILALLESFSALVLAVTLYAITRHEDGDLAMLALICRVAEGVIGGAGISSTLALRWLATSTTANASDVPAAHLLGAYLMRGDTALTAAFFAVGSLLFSWLFLRGRMIPVPLAWLGVLASILVVVALPLQLAGFLHGLINMLIWLPMLAFEVPLAFWLIFKGVAMTGHDTK